MNAQFLWQGYDNSENKKVTMRNHQDWDKSQFCNYIRHRQHNSNTMAGQFSAEYIAIRTTLPKILGAISEAPATITQVSTHLETYHLIPKAVKTEVDNIQISPYDKANKLISAVYTTVDYQPKEFDTFVSILNDCGLGPIANILAEEHEKCELK